MPYIYEISFKQGAYVTYQGAMILETTMDILHTLMVLDSLGCWGNWGKMLLPTGRIELTYCSQMLMNPILYKKHYTIKKRADRAKNSKRAIFVAVATYAEVVMRAS